MFTQENREETRGQSPSRVNVNPVCHALHPGHVTSRCELHDRHPLLWPYQRQCTQPLSWAGSAHCAWFSLAALPSLWHLQPWGLCSNGSFLLSFTQEGTLGADPAVTPTPSLPGFPLKSGWMPPRSYNPSTLHGCKTGII